MAAAALLILSLLTVGLSAAGVGVVATAHSEQRGPSVAARAKVGNVTALRDYSDSTVLAVLEACFRTTDEAVSAALLHLTDDTVRRALIQLAAAAGSEEEASEALTLARIEASLRAQVQDTVATLMLTSTLLPETIARCGAGCLTAEELITEHIPVMPRTLNFTNTTAAMAWVREEHCYRVIPGERDGVLEATLPALASIDSSNDGLRHVEGKARALNAVTATLLALCLLALAVRFWFRVALSSISPVVSIVLAVSAVIAVVAIILTSAWVDKSHDVQVQLSRADAATRAQTESLDALKELLAAVRLYVVSGEARRWFEAQSKEAAFLARTVKQYPNIFSAAEIDRFLDAHAALQRFHRIAAALTMRRVNRTALVEPAMQRVFDATWWDIAAEDLETEAVWFPLSGIPQSGIDVLYSNTAADLRSPDADLLNISVETVFGQRYANWYDAMSSLVSAYASRVALQAESALAATADQARGFRVATLCLHCVLTALTAVGLVALMSQLTQRMGLQSPTGGVSAGGGVGQTRHERLLVRARALFAVMTLVTVACLGIGVAAPLSLTASYRSVASATRLCKELADSFLEAELLKHQNVSALRGVTSPVARLRLLQERWRSAERELFFGTDLNDGSLNALGASSGFDGQMWGNVDWRSWQTVFGQFDTSSCPSASSFTTILLPAPESLTSGFSIWQHSLSLLIAGSNHSDSALKGLEVLAETLIAETAQAGAEFAQYVISRQKALNTVLSVAIAVLLLLLVVGAVAVFVPLASALLQDDESTWHLIAMIPQHVRDSVPAIADFIETGRADSAAELQRKLEQSENLLKNILPAKIANRLKSGEQPIADMHPSVTMCFTDLVGFTATSHSMNATEIVSFLNELFVEFDTIAELMEIEKIKTIGDAYFMVGGLEARIADHALRVVEAGLAFFESLTEHNERHPERKPLRMRLGVHTGPAVAGVIGTKKVAYDLWGRSVEIANAMESTGVPGKVHLSATTLREVRRFFTVVPRGPLPTEKGVPDHMPETFIVSGRLEPSPYQHRKRPRMNKHVPPTVAASPASGGSHGAGGATKPAPSR